MNSKNDYIRQYLGVDVWHNAGYTGSRVSALTGERIEGDNVKEHAIRTAASFHEIAPDAKLTYAPYPGASNTVEPFKAAIGNACVMFMSIAMYGGGGVSYSDPAIPDNLFVAVAAGNEDDDNFNSYIIGKNTYGIGAVDIVWSAIRNGEPLPGAELLVQAAQYTSHSDAVDFGSATGLYTTGYHDRFGGTSCAAPTLAGLAALVNDFFIDKTGKPLSHENMFRFLKDHCEDIEFEGEDDVTGWGIPRLPHPNDIDIAEYQDEEEEVIAPPVLEEDPEVEIEPEYEPETKQENNPIIQAKEFTYEQFVEYMNRYNSENSMTLLEIFHEFGRRLKVLFKN